MTETMRRAELRRLGKTYFLSAEQAESFLEDLEELRSRRAEGGETFSDMLDRLIRESGRKPSQIYREAGLDRRTFYRLRHSDSFPVKKALVMRLGLALRLTAERQEELLRAAGYSFSDGLDQDVAFRLLFDRGRYDRTSAFMLFSEANLDTGVLSERF